MFQITVAQDERRDDERMYHKMTIADLQAKSQFVWMIFKSTKKIFLLNVAESSLTNVVEFCR